MTELAKTFEPRPIEARWYAHWEGQGLFRPSAPDAEPFTIVMPPPNVTGSLHIGHALDNTLQDILVRHARMQGKDALWVVGMDHAGIATQMVVERQLDASGSSAPNRPRGIHRPGVGVEGAVGRAITRQLRRLGASCDWANERFTMDEGFSKAVRRCSSSSTTAGCSIATVLVWSSKLAQRTGYRVDCLLALTAGLPEINKVTMLDPLVPGAMLPHGLSPPC